MRHVFTHIGLRLLLVVFVVIMGMTTITRLIFVNKALILLANHNTLLDVQMGISRPATLAFFDKSNKVCEKFQAPIVNNQPNIPAPTLRPRPDWLEGYTMFFGWSHTEAYLADQHEQRTRIWNAANQTILYESPGEVENLWWSPNDSYVAMVIGNNPAPSFHIVNLATHEETFIALSPDFIRYYALAQWAPDESSIAMSHRDPSNNHRLGVYHVDGRADYDITHFLYPEYPISQDIPFYWSADSKRLSFWAKDWDSYRLLEFDTVSGSTKQYTQTARSIFYTTETPHISAAYQDNGDDTYSIEVFDLYTMLRTSFIEHADDLGNPVFNPTGEWVHATYDADPAPTRKIRLAWMKSDGTNYREYKNSTYLDIRHVIWSNTGEKLAFVGVHPDNTYDVIIANTLTGETQTIITRARDLLHRQSSETRASYYYSYTDANLNWHYIGLDEMFNILFYGDTSTYVNRVQEFHSPDGEQIVLKLHGKTPKRFLAFAAKDDPEFTIIRDDLDQYEPPSWSADGNLFKIAIDIQNHKSETIIYNQAGKEVVRLVQPNGTWYACK